MMHDRKLKAKKTNQCCLTPPEQRFKNNILELIRNDGMQAIYKHEL
jgi:hypothetical protein